MRYACQRTTTGKKRERIADRNRREEFKQVADQPASYVDKEKEREGAS
jgi:hypothetical protein